MDGSSLTKGGRYPSLFSFAIFLYPTKRIFPPASGACGQISAPGEAARLASLASLGLRWLSYDHEGRPLTRIEKAPMESRDRCELVWRILSDNSTEAIEETLKEKEATSRKSTIQGMANPKSLQQRAEK